MASIVEIMKSIPDFIGSNGRTEEEIQCAEQALGTTFAPDYRQYLKEIGLAAFDGHELTGITKAKRVNVVEVTLEERARNANIPADWYVVEQANIDGIVIWQSPTGEIYQAALRTVHQTSKSLKSFIFDKPIRA